MKVTARLRAIDELATSIGWNTQRFARMKTIKPLAEYLKPILTKDQQRDRDAMAVKAMFDRMEAKQKRAKGPAKEKAKRDSR